MLNIDWSTVSVQQGRRLSVDELKQRSISLVLKCGQWLTSTDNWNEEAQGIFCKTVRCLTGTSHNLETCIQTGFSHSCTLFPLLHALFLTRSLLSTFYSGIILLMRKSWMLDVLLDLGLGVDAVQRI